MNKRSALQTTLVTIAAFALTGQVPAVSALPDPTRPADWLQKSEPVFAEEVQQSGNKIEWRVNAIRIAPDDRTAIVNGKLVRAGDRVSNGIVREIRRDSVVVEDDTRQLILRLISNKAVKDYSNYERADKK